MARQKKGVDGVVGVGKQGGECRRHQLVAGEEREIIEAARFRRKNRGGHGWGRGFEAHAEEDDRGVGVFGGEGQGVERGIDHRDPRALGLCVFE